MDYALGAAFFYAWSVTCARRSSAHHGPDLANLGRLLVGILIVGLIVAFSGRHPFCAGWGWLILGGVLGLGIGDIALPLAQLLDLGLGIAELAAEPAQQAVLGGHGFFGRRPLLRCLCHWGKDRVARLRGCGREKPDNRPSDGEADKSIERPDRRALALGQLIDRLAQQQRGQHTDGLTADGQDQGHAKTGL